MTQGWMDVARGHLGLAEVAGAGSNPEIMRWAQEEGGWIASYFKDDGIAWCALFACHCLHAAGFKDPRTLAAGDFAEWGQALAGPCPGAVAVLERPGGHHVAFYLGQSADGKRVRLLGGNQHDSVREDWFDVHRVIAWRYPSELPAPAPEPVLLADDGTPASANEG